MTLTEQRLYRENERLRADLSAALAELSVRAERDRSDALRNGFGLTVCEAELLAAILKANGRTLSRDHLHGLVATVTQGRAPEWRSADVLICRVRKKTGYSVIETVRGLGWRISPEGKRLCNDVLKPKAEDIGDTIISIARVP